MEKTILRKGIDHTGVAVVYFCHDGEGKFVMARRSVQARDEQGRWDIGGGGVEFGEVVEETLRKEIKEEYACDVIEHEFLGIRDVHRVHDNLPTHWITLDFKVKVDPSQVKINEPHKFDDLGWFTLESLPDPIHSQLGDFFTRYQGRL